MFFKKNKRNVTYIKKNYYDIVIKDRSEGCV